MNSKYISVTGLIVGSMAPDFEYFFRMESFSQYSHTLLGILYYDLPMSLFLSILFHQIIKGPLIANMPGYFKKRCSPLFDYNFLHHLKSHKIAFTISAIIGSASHIFWDGFTYEGGFFIKIFPLLSNHIVLGEFTIGVYKFVQFGSTILGGLILLLYFHFLPEKRNPFPNKINYVYWLLIAAIMTILIYQPIATGFQTNRISNYSVTIISGGLLGLAVTSTLFWILNPSKYQPSSISNS